MFHFEWSSYNKGSHIFAAVVHQQRNLHISNYNRSHISFMQFIHLRCVCVFTLNFLSNVRVCVKLRIKWFVYKIILLFLVMQFFIFFLWHFHGAVCKQSCLTTTKYSAYLRSFFVSFGEDI